VKIPIDEHQDDLYNDDFEIPTIDLSTLLTNRDDFIQKFGEALTKIGFVILVNHGINTDIFDTAEKKTFEFFETVPQEEKEKFHMQKVGPYTVGYFPSDLRSQISKNNGTSLKEEYSLNLLEGWKFFENAFNVENNPEFIESDFWPRTGYEPVFREYYLSQLKLVVPLMTCLLQYFKLDPQIIDNHKLTNLKTHIRGVRLNYYRALKPEDFLNKSPRLFPHEDLSVITTIPAPSSEGLQVLNRDDKKWVRVNAPKNSLILNAGNYLQRITNDVIPSSTHRVIKPSPSQNFARISYTFAFVLEDNEILEVLPGLNEPKYQPIRCADFHTQVNSKYYDAKTNQS